MKAEKRLGIWMDHSSAHLMEFTPDPIETKTIESAFTYFDKKQSIKRSEQIMHNKEQHQQSEYYKKLGEVIINYDEVILFGPTEAKSELFNSLKDNHHFSKVKIEVKQADRMTEDQQHAFVKEHFSKKVLTHLF